ncbi:phosphopentomutase [Mycoplasma sp. 2045]|uniref:phosphopentomutase n=3 Tax=Mycoplasma TaxID=2093 RepID=UPI00211C6B8F|nr:MULTISPECIES: phosphopentomutase [unclassified Mycoplasma]MEA4134273.1 phosphopentomutase [Mycoplasma sp. 2704]MEA4162609.1 phosphopentomutase [Mycoplasma sp. 4404]MEA4190909.1 phosphopentomutase [Mycoplasma sp. 2248]MEA4276165.1 phosphopentomutase [Mycoplasma sp. 21DD0573]UUM20647.1 phosphopentomutase [Mycoplasma sp. 2045]
MAKFKRVFMIVTDGLGIGPDKDQKRFGDDGANSIRSASMVDEFKIDTWRKLGIGNITDLNGDYRQKNQMGYVAKIQEVSNAKDTLAGHWEMMGIKTLVPFPTFAENGFPQELIDELSKAFDGRPIVGNKAASGTDIINELAHEEKERGAIIVYTSNDSVLQICAHEEWTGLDNLYKYAKAAREICSSRPEWNVGRIIARPYIGEEGNYTRTFNRHDYANQPREMILNELQKAGVEVISIGKINDIFVGQGISRHIPSGSDEKGMDATIELAMQDGENQFIFTNLVQFDSHFGHRRNVRGYAQNIADLDVKLGKLINVLKEDDLLIMTSDHGNDPLYPGFNHTREYLPLTVYSKSFKSPKVLPVLEGLGTTGNIVARNFGVDIVTETGEDIFDKLV